VLEQGFGFFAKESIGKNNEGGEVTALLKAGLSIFLLLLPLM
jgi:hypothetical protein